MKTVSLLVAEADPGTVGDFEIIGAFSGDFELVQWLWTELKLRPGFSAWPIGGDRERAQDVEFLENVAELQLRPYHPAKAIAGLGPLSVRKVWIKQHNLEGDFNWLVVKYEIADIRAEEVQDYKDLRSVMSKGGMVYTHVNSSLGQRIEEDLTRAAARGVQQTIHSLRTGGAVLDDPPNPEEALFVCESCTTAPLVGVVFPMASNGMTNHAYIERCDECGIFRDDTAAAVALAHMFKLDVDVEERPFVKNMTFDQALEWNRKHLRSEPQS